MSTKEFKKEYANCSMGDVKVSLGEYDDGDQYQFNIDIFLDGLYCKKNNDSRYGPFDPVKINIKGRGIEELRLMSDMFRDISDFIKENI